MYLNLVQFMKENGLDTLGMVSEFKDGQMELVMKDNGN
jgi:hypothetical protein